MMAFDTDVLTDVFHGTPAVIARVALLAAADLFIPVTVVDEVLRGRLAVVRQAEAGKGRIDLPQAYELLQRTVPFLCGFQILTYTLAADALFRQWRAAKIRVGSQDLRIAAVCIDHGVTLVTRNARDYVQVPGLNFDVWN